MAAHCKRTSFAACHCQVSQGHRDDDLGGVGPGTELSAEAIHLIDNPSFVLDTATSMMSKLSENEQRQITTVMNENPTSTMSVGTGCSGSDLYIDTWEACCEGNFSASALMSLG
jgi:hypothetical protein